MGLIEHISKKGDRKKSVARQFALNGNPPLVSVFGLSRYDFTDSISGVSNESIGMRAEGVYDVNIENDHIDLWMFDYFDNSNHTAVVPENMFVESPVLPWDDSGDSDEAPLSTGHLTDHYHPISSHVNQHTKKMNMLTCTQPKPLCLSETSCLVKRIAFVWVRKLI